MSGKLGSEFIDDFEKEETGLFGMSFRQIVLVFSVITLIIVIGVVIFLELPEIIYTTYGSLVTIPGVIFGASIDKKFKLKERLYFFFLEKRRVYYIDSKKGDKE